MARPKVTKQLKSAIWELFGFDPEGADADLLRLIAQASQDLYYGPSGEEDYPGFTSATRTIARRLGDVGDIWIDEDSGDVTDKEPSFCDCDDSECDADHGGGDWYHYDRSDVIAMLVGKELAPYLR